MQTFFEALVLVVLVVYLFLHSFRVDAHPDAGGAGIDHRHLHRHDRFGFSINMLTLFGMVLAIGIVVDDAIVVIENVERNMNELDLPPKEAAKRAMDEVRGPVIAIVLVLCAVFVPVAFLGGITGPALQAVRDHHRDLGGDLRHRGADALARAGRPAAQAGTRARSAVSSRGSSGVRRITDGYAAASRS